MTITFKVVTDTFTTVRVEIFDETGTLRKTIYLDTATTGGPTTTRPWNGLGSSGDTHLGILQVEAVATSANGEVSRHILQDQAFLIQRPLSWKAGQPEFLRAFRFLYVLRSSFTTIRARVKYDSCMATVPDYEPVVRNNEDHWWRRTTQDCLFSGTRRIYSTPISGNPLAVQPLVVEWICAAGQSFRRALARHSRSHIDPRTLR